MTPGHLLPCTCNVRYTRAVCLLWFLGSPRERLLVAPDSEPSSIQIQSGCNAAVGSQRQQSAPAEQATFPNKGRRLLTLK